MNEKNIIFSASEKANALTPSVLVVARLAKVTPKVLAVALAEDMDNATYRADVASELIKVEMAKAIEAEKDK